MSMDEVFSLEFPINIRKQVLKYSLKFVPLESTDDDTTPSQEVFDKSAF